MTFDPEDKKHDGAESEQAGRDFPAFAGKSARECGSAAGNDGRSGFPDGVSGASVSGNLYPRRRKQDQICDGPSGQRKNLLRGNDAARGGGRGLSDGLDFREGDLAARFPGCLSGNPAPVRARRDFAGLRESDHPRNGIRSGRHSKRENPDGCAVRKGRG